MKTRRRTTPFQSTSAGPRRLRVRRHLEGLLLLSTGRDGSREIDVHAVQATHVAYQLSEYKSSHNTCLGELAKVRLLPTLGPFGKRAYHHSLGTRLAFWDTGAHPDYVEAANPVNEMVLDYVVEACRDRRTITREDVTSSAFSREKMQAQIEQLTNDIKNLKAAMAVNGGMNLPDGVQIVYLST